MLSKHTAVALGGVPDRAMDLSDSFYVASETLPCVTLTDKASSGTVLSYTVIHRRDKADRAVVLAATPEGAHCLATTDDAETVAALLGDNPIGSGVWFTQGERCLNFALDGR